MYSSEWVFWREKVIQIAQTDLTLIIAGSHVSSFIISFISMGEDMMLSVMVAMAEAVF